MERLRHALAPFGALIVGLLLGGVVLLLSGHDPIGVARAFAERVLARRTGIEESLVAMTPILIAGIAAWIAARVGLWNIGIDGQVVAGAVVAGGLAPLLDGWPRVLMWVAVVIAAMAGGAAWIAVPAALRVHAGINEIVTTIMMTYVGFSVASWLVKGPLRDESVVSPATSSIDVAQRLPRLFETRVHLGVVAAIVVLLIVWIVSRWSVPGVLSRLIGEAPSAAETLGLPVNRYLIAGFLLSGAVAALAGGLEVIATRGALQGDWRPSLTLSAFAVLYLGRRHALGLLPAALLLGTFAYASTVLPRVTGVPPDFFPLLEGILLVLLAVEHWEPWRFARSGEATS